MLSIYSEVRKQLFICWLNFVEIKVSLSIDSYKRLE